ncbi:DUF424 family protein [Candidatus Woesearchaeota archaeon]|nr:DUF424 family protein [Candidatus Woesearchaeota archaeon]
MIIKIHKTEDGRTLVAAIDDSLKGTTHIEGDKKLDFTAEFYNGETCPPQEAGDIIRNADMLNIAGKETIKIAIEEGAITEEQVLKIAGIPYAQAVVE